MVVYKGLMVEEGPRRRNIDTVGERFLAALLSQRPVKLPFSPTPPAVLNHGVTHIPSCPSPRPSLHVDQNQAIRESALELDSDAFVYEGCARLPWPGMDIRMRVLAPPTPVRCRPMLAKDQRTPMPRHVVAHAVSSKSRYGSECRHAARRYFGARLSVDVAGVHSTLIIFETSSCFSRSPRWPLAPEPANR